MSKTIQLTGLENLVNKASLNETNPFNTKFIPVNKIVEHELNEGRQTKENINKLKQSILDAGLLQPLLVYKLQNGNYKIISGHGRLKAIQQLKDYRFNGAVYLADEVPVIIDKTNRDEIEHRLNVLRSNAQKDETIKDKVETVRKAETIYLLLRKNGTITEQDATTKRKWIADITGYSQSSVKLYLNTIHNQEKTKVNNPNIQPEDFERKNYKKIISYLNKVNNLLEETLSEDGVQEFNQEVKQLKTLLNQIIVQVRNYD